MIYRTVVSGHEDFHPVDYLHDSKTPQEFESDVKAILAACPVESLERYEFGGKIRNCYITGYSIQEYLDSELLKLGYAKAEIHPVYLNGECLYDTLDEFTDAFPDDIKQRILENNKIVGEELD